MAEKRSLGAGMAGASSGPDVVREEPGADAHLQRHGVDQTRGGPSGNRRIRRIAKVIPGITETVFQTSEGAPAGL